MKLINTKTLPHGKLEFTFKHKVKGTSLEYKAEAMNQKSAEAKCWKQVSATYKSQKQCLKFIL